MVLIESRGVELYHLEITNSLIELLLPEAIEDDLGTDVRLPPLLGASYLVRNLRSFVARGQYWAELRLL